MLSVKQQKCIMISIAKPELNDTQLAKEVGVSKMTMVRWRKDPEFIEAEAAELKKQWQGAAKKAQKRMLELLDSTRADVAIQASKYILSSNGYDAPQKIEADVNEKVIKVDIIDDD